MEYRHPRLDVPCKLVVRLPLVEAEEDWVWILHRLFVEVGEAVVVVMEEVGPDRDEEDVGEDGDCSEDVGANLDGEKQESLGMVEGVNTLGHLDTLTTGLHLIWRLYAKVFPLKFLPLISSYSMEL